MNEAFNQGFVPPAGAPWRARCAFRVLRFFGWRVAFDGHLPAPQGVIIAYPHTSNWDFPIGLLAIWTLNLPIRWIGKETVFTGWFGALAGPLLQRWGGRPVNRHAPSGAVGELAQLMAREPEFWLALSPEGTRRRLRYWRSGFYHLTRNLKVPLGLAYFDFASRTVGISAFIEITGDVAVDMQRIATAYTGRHGLYPELESVIALDPAATGSASPTP